MTNNSTLKKIAMLGKKKENELTAIVLRWILILIECVH
jgi:hypothetical protein